MANHLDHALHNQTLAEQLYTDGKYLDWCVTVAYYACIHFAKHRLFPLDKKDHDLEWLQGSIEHFDDYCKYKAIVEKHAAICDLFIDKIDRKHGLSLRMLMNDCMTARYNNYETDPRIAQRAISTMQSISKLCSSKPSTPAAAKRLRKPTSPDLIRKKT